MSPDLSPSNATPSSHLAVRCLDLTSLDGDETEERIRALCDRAVQPDPNDPEIPSVAAVVLYPAKVAEAAGRLAGTAVKVASVAGFPSAEGPLEVRLAEIRRAVEDGAAEIDIVLNRPLFLSGRTDEARVEIRRAKEAAGSATLKVILETGKLESPARIRDAAMLAMTSGADFIKTSTGKVGTGATIAGAKAMMEAAGEFHGDTGIGVGIKVSGGVRTAEQAMDYLELLEDTLGSAWLTPDRFRIGASALLDDLVVGMRAERSHR
jgi:deoxyribose-phosphate aldolase